MRREHLFLLAIPLILITACDGTQPAMEDCAEICDDLINDANDIETGEDVSVNCPFDTCFSPGPYVKEVYFTYKPIKPLIKDTECNDAFEERYNASTYLCFIKQAEPIVNVGRNAEGKDTWQWRVDCACSYQR
ncbi:hypothetical protein JXA12_05225 [Candidatus Woesearchaeota archaeon]|nr:hypothetical protein [Candidatus Woesearchaeota archaeon]